ncbi:hypothetical protein JCM5353_002504 [Sporobolomyces roseus]
MSTSRSTSPEVTPKSPRAAEPPYSPPELPFLRDPRGNPVPPQAGLTFETMSEEEGFEFLGIKEDFNPVEMLVKIEAAQKEHEKDQPLSQRKKLNGAILAATATLSLRLLAKSPKPSSPTNAAMANDSANVEEGTSSKKKGSRGQKEKDKETLPDMLQTSPHDVEIAMGESELSLAVQAAMRLHGLFYEILTDEARHHFRLVLPSDFFETESMSAALNPVFPNDHPRTRALAAVVDVPTTIVEARKILGIEKDADGPEVLKRWLSFSTMDESSDRPTVARAIGAVVLLGAHQENGVNLTSIFMRSVFAYETGRILHNILYQARVPNPFADEVVKDVFREHAEHDLSGEHVEEKQRLRSENEDMKQKRKKDLAVIQGLRKEVKELKSQARAKLSSTSQSRNGSKTSATTLRESTASTPSTIDSETQTKSSLSIIELLTAQNRELNATLQREREENVSEDGETRGINFVEALSKIEEARAEHEKDQPLSQLKLLNGAILAVTAPAALRTKFTGGKEAEDTSMNSSSVAIPSKAQHSPSHDSKLTRLEHSKQVKQQRVGHVEDLREGSSEIVLGQSEFARNFQAYDRLNSIFYETLINEIRHDFRATLPVEFYEIEGMMPSMLEPVFLGNHSSNRFSAKLPQMKDAPDRTTIAQGLGSLILLAVHGANGLSRSSALLHHAVNQEATRAARQVLQEAGLTLAGADEVIRDAILTRVGLDSEETREKEQKARRRESNAMKKKRKEDLAIIEGLRKELQEAKSEAQEREKVQDESSTASKPILSVLDRIIIIREAVDA